MSELPTAEIIAGPSERSFTSSWFTVDQAMIDRFADATHDHQFIHVDPARAKAETPFGGTIAHGFLSLSLLSAMAVDCVPRPAEAVMGINYGFEKIRFLAPVASGKRVRGHFILAEAALRNPNELLTTYDVTVEIEGEDKPALAARWLTMAIVET